MNIFPILILVIVVTICTGGLMQCHSDIKKSEMRIECEKIIKDKP
jgi:uncharacterized membrane protein YjgN (DUF898 family)